MTPDLVAELLRQLMKEAMILSAPVLVAAVVLGFVLTLFQTLTSLQEQSLTSVPRLGCGGAHSACRHAVVSRPPCGLHAAPDV